MIKAIVGANWGDEGKGKITDVIAAQSDIVIRFQGGSNAGHTIINNYGKFALHQLPSGIFYDHTTSIIGNGVALSVENFIKELSSLEERNVPKPNILISDRAQIVMPYQTELKKKIERVLAVKNTLYEHLYHQPPLKVDDVFNKLMEYKELIAPYVTDTFEYLYEAVKEGKNILLEGQLGALKDPDFGIYPMVTSSSTLAGYGAVGAGLPPYEIKEIIAVVKAYSSAVGAGEFVSEIFGEEADELRRRGGDGGEFGATTGRPRRMGWLDLVASRYGCRVQGATTVAFAVLDVLGYLDEIPVCVAYELDGKRIDYFPSTAQLKRCKPILETLPGWKCDIRGIKKYEDLPENCRKYIEFAEKEIGVPFGMISNGPSRDDIIYR